MDYKEKYEQALERARQFSEKPYLEDSAGIVEYIFPELAESEDERIRKGILELVRQSSEVLDKQNQNNMIAWLEKQGEQKSEEVDNLHNYLYGEQKSSEWSEEDESHIRYLIECLENCKKGVALTMTTSTAQEYINWLKSISSQSQWKPSEEQMEYLAKAITTLGNEGDNKTSAILYELRTDLKKLKG